MKNFLAAVLSVIAVGVLLIAYGLLAPRTMAAPAVDNGSVVTLDPNRYAAPALSERVLVRESTAQPVYANYVPQTAAPQRTVYVTEPAPRIARTSRTVTTTRVERRRDWKKTALVIGGSTAAGAGVGGAFGGKKGALAGAAIGGGISSLWEALHR